MTLNDLERPVTQISRSCHNLTMKISEMVQDTNIYSQWNTNRDLHTSRTHSRVSFRMILSDLEWLCEIFNNIALSLRYRWASCYYHWALEGSLVITIQQSPLPGQWHLTMIQWSTCSSNHRGIYRLRYLITFSTKGRVRRTRQVDMNAWNFAPETKLTRSLAVTKSLRDAPYPWKFCCHSDIQGHSNLRRWELPKFIITMCLFCTVYKILNVE